MWKVKILRIFRIFIKDFLFSFFLLNFSAVQSISGPFFLANSAVQYMKFSVQIPAVID